MCREFEDWWGYLASNCAEGMSEATETEKDEGGGHLSRQEAPRP